MIREKALSARFYRTASGNEPVREWLQELQKEEKKAIGEDIKTVQFGWPIGMPLVDNISKGIWEVRSKLPTRKIARVLFAVVNEEIVLLHGFIKKTRATPDSDKKIALKRLKEISGG
ncbi:MAG: type II toxin-antitoxin system RelE/ParE family toxin [Mariprofundaceae bacterium]|nr:type II toxin-antitoxin system RelE/ParE family toxin [Mariprofundaceae bacterium]